MIKEFKVYYGTTPATKEQLDAIEEIVVEQEIGRAWEARIKIPVCIAEDGSWAWRGRSGVRRNSRACASKRASARVNFLPLIDGRIVGKQDPGMNANPGQQLGHADGTRRHALLHREAGSEDSPPGSRQRDRPIAIFESAALGGAVDIDETGAARQQCGSVVQRTGPRCRFSGRSMSRHRDYYAYVLPGDRPGPALAVLKTSRGPPTRHFPALSLTGRAGTSPIQHSANTQISACHGSRARR